MSEPLAETEKLAKRTQWAYVGTRVLDTPFWGIFNMLPFILYKDLHATPYQLAVLVTLKPLVSIISSYWSVWLNQRSDRIVGNIICTRFLAILPFFFFPFFDSPWFFIASFGLYMMLASGVVPTWMELLKQNIPQVKRENIFSFTQVFGYFGGGLLPFVLGGVLDDYNQAWRWIFPIAGGLSLCASIFQWNIIIKPGTLKEKVVSQNFGYHLMRPWKTAWNLLKQRPDFTRYQIGFMLIGGGLMIMQPALPVYFVDVLHLSYMEFAIALTLCKGVGFAAGSPLWSKWINRMNIYRFSGWIAGLACCFPVALLLTQSQIVWLYIGYFAYGFMQSGNELSWNMSGPIFSKEHDSTVYTSINVMAVGVRGAFIPSLGALLIASFNASFVMILGGIICFFATLLFFAFAFTAQKHTIKTAP